MESFVGRSGELDMLRAELERVRSTGAGRFVWMRGRRRVGKSRLAQELCGAADTPYCFFQAPRRPRSEALRDFCEAVAESSLDAAEDFAGATFASWPAALRAASAGASAARPAIVVIDELPYLTERDPGFGADLQKAWDRDYEHRPVLLVCIGSDVRMMEELVAERSPLHGRPTRELRVEPLDPAAVAAVTRADDASDAIDRYLIVGGLPLLAASWPHGASREDFLREALADDQTPFVTSAERIMASEFRADLQARKVIEAIGHGETAHGRIASRSGVKGNTLSDALGVLVDTKRTVDKALPFAVPPGRTAAKYTVLDPYLRFWLRFVGPRMAELSRGRSDLVVDRVLRDWSAYRGRAVEPLVRGALERLLTDEEFALRLGGARHVGSYWTRTHAVEVDLVGGDAPSPSTIGFVGSIKWHEREPFGAREAAALAVHRSRVPGGAAARLLAVSRTGAESGTAVDVVIGPDELLSAWRAAPA
jgi:AAA+ ATPase superfamily predicted ATPase